MRHTAAGEYRLIDIDCICEIGQNVGSKENNSSAFAPPEMTFRDDGGTVLLKDSSNKGNWPRTRVTVFASGLTAARMA